jgi:glycosyltransferase involved in cell wall biosynthesis
MPADRLTVSAIIPAYREERFIAEVVRGVARHVDQIIVIDDGSTDRTAAAAQEAGARVIRHATNHGKGAALKTGIRAAQNQTTGYFLFLDGDGQHDPADIPVFFETADRTGADLVVGNRMGDLATMPTIRRIINRFMSWQIGALCGRELPDSQCGFRLAKRELTPLLLASSDAFDFETESILLAVRDGRKIEFVPVRTIYRDEQSKIRPIRDTWRYLQVLGKYARSAGRKARKT